MFRREIGLYDWGNVKCESTLLNLTILIFNLIEYIVERFLISDFIKKRSIDVPEVLLNRKISNAIRMKIRHFYNDPAKNRVNDTVESYNCPVCI